MSTPEFGEVAEVTMSHNGLIVRMYSPASGFIRWNFTDDYSEEMILQYLTTNGFVLEYSHSNIQYWKREQKTE